MSYMSWKGEMFIEYSISALKYISVSGGGGGWLGSRPCPLAFHHHPPPHNRHKPFPLPPPPPCQAIHPSLLFPPLPLHPPTLYPPSSMSSLKISVAEGVDEN